MLHGGNGPHDMDPAYDPASNFDIQADLAIYVNSELVALPADIGVNGNQLTSFVHTEDGDPNRLHLDPGGEQPTEFVHLGDFFDIWRTNAGSAGNNPNAILSDTQLFDNVVDENNTLQAYVNGERLESGFAEYQIHDGDNIVLTYGSNPVITLDTNAGDIPVLLLSDEAPETVENFLRYANGGVDSNGYVGSIFHRNDTGFVLQGGGFRPTSLTTTDIDEIQGDFNAATGDFEHHIPTFDPIPDERMAGDRSNTAGTFAMAKNSAGATSEFFFNVGDNSFLDAQGFTVFALALGSTKPDDSLVDSAPINLITNLTNIDVDPSNDGTGAFSVFDNVPYTSQGEMVEFEAVLGEGVVRGLKFNDVNGDGVQNNGETGLQGFTIFSDANGNGMLDAGEVSAVTDVNGDYFLRLAAGTHTIREVPDPGFTQTFPTNPDSYTVDVEIGGELLGRDFGNTGVVAPSAVDLVASTDSGSSDADNLTNFNNSSPATAPQFTVSGVSNGATVQIRVDGVVMGEEMATGDSVTITLDGANTIADGTRQVTAVQSLGGAFGNPVSLEIVVDTGAPTFTSTPPTTAVADEGFAYNADTDDEVGDGATYVIVDPTTGDPVTPVTGSPVINPLTGTFAWTPSLDDIGSHDFAIEASDVAGNATTQMFTLDVQEPVVIEFRLDVTKDGQAISANNPVMTGDEILLSVFVDDVRMLANPNLGGVFSAYLDVLYDSSIVSVNGNLSYGSVFSSGQNGSTSQAGVIDAAGAFSGSISPIGQGEQLLWSIPMLVTGSGTLTFEGEPTTDPNDPGDAGQTPNFDAGVYQAGDDRYDRPVGPSASPSFGTMRFIDATVTVGARFSIVDFQFQPEEDSTNNPISVASVTSNPDNLTLTFVGTPTAEHGTVTIGSNSTELLYTPDADYTGVDTISFNVTDGEDTLSADQELFVFNLNDPPTAVDDTATVDEDALEPVFIDVLANDLTDPDPASEQTRFRVDSVQSTSANGGVVTIAGVGLGITYSPPANFIGQDTFTYTMSDRDPVDPQTSTATVTVTVEAVNDPPTANADRFGDAPNLIQEDSVDNVLDVLANDSSAPDTNETISIVAGGFTQPANGTVTLSGSGDVLYTPDPDFIGEDSFTYTITDDDPDDPRTATATVVVVVSNVNDDPTANDDTDLRVTENTTENTLDLLANDSIAPDVNETLTITGVSNITAGATVEVAADGLSVLYTPVADFLGTDTFTYTISDGNGGTDTATATVEVVEFIPGSLSGFVYVDANDNGLRESTERVLEDITITLTGTDIFGSVNRTAQTAADGSYTFAGLAPGDYVITQTQPAEDLDNDGIPLLDGRDTIGSQGGVAGQDGQGRDTFTVTLAEGVNGTGNNFGEVKGRTIAVTVTPRAGTITSGLTVDLMQDGQAVRESTTTDADGKTSFVGLVPGTYQVQVSGPFLLETSTEVVVGDQGAVIDVGVGEPLINPIFLTYLDSLSTRSTEFAGVAVDATTQHWFAAGSDWQNADRVEVELDASGDAFTVTIEDAEGTFQGSIPDTNPLIHVLNQLEDQTSRVRLNGSREEFKVLLTQVTTNGDGEGEGEAAPIPVNGSPLFASSAARSAGLPTQPVAAGSNEPDTQQLGEPPVADLLAPADGSLGTGLEVGEGEGDTPAGERSQFTPAAREESFDLIFATAGEEDDAASARQAGSLVDEDTDDLLAALDNAFAEETFVDDLSLAGSGTVSP